MYGTTTCPHPIGHQLTGLHTITYCIELSRADCLTELRIMYPYQVLKHPIYHHLEDVLQIYLRILIAMYLSKCVCIIVFKHLTVFNIEGYIYVLYVCGKSD